MEQPRTSSPSVTFAKPVSRAILQYIQLNTVTLVWCGFPDSLLRPRICSHVMLGSTLLMEMSEGRSSISSFWAKMSEKLSCPGA